MNSKSIIMWGTSEMLLVLLLTIFCHYLRPAQSSVVLPTRFDTSNEWKTIELTNLNDDEQFYEPMNIKNGTHGDSNNSNNNNNKKLVEWDDDDNFVGASLVVQEPKLTKLEQVTGQQKSRFGKTGKLVYHGQLKRNNSKVNIDGLSLKVNTYLPHSINRNQQITTRVLSHQHHNHQEHQHQPSSSQANVDILTYERPRNIEMNINQNSLIEDIETHLKSENDWHPIIVLNKYRQSHSSFEKTKTRIAEEKLNGSKKLLVHSEPIEISEEATMGNSKWRPITSNEVNKRLLTRKMRESITYGRKRSEVAYQPVAPSHIEESFEDDRLVVSRGESRREHRISEQQQKQRNKSNSSRIGLARKIDDGQWTPLEMNPKKVHPTKQVVTSTVEPATATTRAPSHNHSDTAQRSASDVNYIYSSQPNSQYDYGSSDSRQTNYYPTAGYYSNYYNGQQQDSSGGAIVDTVSGQTPEMIDRTQEPAGYQSDYGSSYSTSYPASTRPYSYDTSGYYTSLSRTQIPLRQASPPVQQSQAPVLRQEHHYHYYNPQQQLDRQQLIQQQQQPQVVREIQPLLISQPQVIQALPLVPSSTPAPQIIREIIKEVPQQVPVHFQPIPLAPRILLAPPPPLPPPIALPVARATREQEPSYAYGGGGSYGDSYGGVAQSRSLIRHFSSAMPTIGIRQIRVPVPAIQIPLRVAVAAPLPPPTPSVTRQTGSFLVPPQPQKTTTYLTETQAMPTHTTIMQTTQFTPATRTTVFTTDHQVSHPTPLVGSSGYKKK